MKNLFKLTVFLFLVTSLLTTYYFVQVPSLMADDDAIPNPIVPCTDKESEGWKNPEFNSMRPYQASPCGDAPKAFYCSNDYIIEEKVSTEWNNRCGSDPFICPYKGPIIKRDYEIFLGEVDLPILGNTELTANSASPDDQIDDAEKVNEYLTWYLSGTNQKAEQGNDTIDETINFSGPVKKLLPSVIQELQRLRVLRDAGVFTEYTEDNEMEGSARDIDPEKVGVQVDETSNHNQIVVCLTKNVRLFGFNINNPWVGEEIPTPCYEGGGKADGALRMLMWWEGKQSGVIEALKVIPGWDGSRRWSYATPPFPWQFTKDIHYQKAYREWRGHECLIVLGKLVCADLKIPGIAELHTNKWADFYQYIPLGTPADKASSHVVTGLNIEGLGGTKAERPQQAPGISAPNTYFIEQNPVLYYPHTKAAYEMTKLLNDTQSPRVQEEQGTQGDSSALAESTDFEKNKCKIVDVRSNPGDSLTFSNDIIDEIKQRVLVRGVQIEVTQVGCLNDGEIRYYLDNCPNPLDPKCGGTPSCDGIVQVVIPTTPKIPHADHLWRETTVAQDSAFRRIFPKIEEGAPVSCIADIPGVSDVEYTPGSETNLVKVNTPDGKKNPGDAQLFFPHLGTIYEYFLNGIQTALRPKGYGDPITNGELCVTDDTKSCEQVAEEYGIPSCQLEGIMALETGRGTNMGSESCGKFNCCSAGVCGPAQIKCGDVEAVSGGEDINVCDPCGASELLARLMKMKLCQADGKCNSYNWNDMERVAMPYEVEDGDYTAACYFYGLQNGCFPTACTQYRWGAGRSYDDAVRSMCETGNPFIGTRDDSFCAACAEEDPRLQCAI